MNPAQAVVGERVEWVVDGFSREVEDPVMLLAVYYSDTLLPVLIPGETSPEGWSFAYEVPENAFFLSYKIEDDQGPLIDDNGFNIGVSLYEKSGKPRYNTGLYNAAMHYESQIQDMEKVIEFLEAELQTYPENWTAFIFLRDVQLEKGEVSLRSVIDELDSFLAEEPDSIEGLLFITMEFKLSSQMLITEGEKLLLKCAEEYPGSGHWLRNQSLIYNALAQIPGRFENYEKTIFPLLKGEAKKTAYLTVIAYAVETGNIEHAEEVIANYYDEFPSADLPIMGLMGLLQAKYAQPSTEWAEEIEGWLKHSPDNLDFNLALAYYYKDRDWKKATSYFRRAIKGTDSPQPVVNFAEVAAEKGKNFAEARKYLQKAIEEVNLNRYREMLILDDFVNRRKIYTANKALLYNTLGFVYLKSGDYEAAVTNLMLADSFQMLIPGYEKTIYERLLEASGKAGDLESRKIALINLYAQESEKKDYVIALNDIYTLEYGSSENFSNWLDDESRKVFLRFKLNQPVPDFSVAGPLSDTLRLSDFSEKVVVLNIWGTWCGPCKDEIPELNNLIKYYEDSEDVIFLAVANEPPEVVDSFLVENRFDYQLVYELPTMEVTRIFQIQSVPTHLVIDKKGNLQYQHIGFMPGIVENLVAEVDALLNEQ